MSMCCGRWSNEAATVHADITADHSDVPASAFILVYLHVMGFSSQRITTMIHFLSTVCESTARGTGRFEPCCSEEG